MPPNKWLRLYPWLRFPLKLFVTTSIEQTISHFIAITVIQTNNMRFTNLLCCLAATASTALAQDAYSAPSSTTILTTTSAPPTSSSAPPLVSSAPLSSSSAPPSSSSAVQMTSYVLPVNCTSACTTVYEPCTESAAVTPAPYGTGSWTAPPAPPATGGYVARPPAPEPSTWVMPTGPSPTPEPEPSPSTSVTPYTGDAAERLVGSGIVLAMVGLLQLVV